ncbi:MAG: metallophosphoesterase [Clostridium sp.]|nr:metallophosphoesterase [Clostridium sp.]MCM1460565.1 metallophosphoesterase [Bacteroides sp.]
MSTKNKPKQKKIKKWIILACVAVGLFCFAWYENHHLVITYYDYQSDKIGSDLNGYCIVQISDLHNATFGRDNKKLISKIKGLSPDMVVITGDIVDSSHTDIDAAVQFVSIIAKEYPTYYVTGNHEYWLEETDRHTLMKGLEQAGAIILNNEKITISAGAETFELIGLDDKSLGDSTLKNLTENCGDRDFILVLAHEPQYIQEYSNTKTDLLLCGHAHGGQFILPFIGAVVAPDQGFLPAYTAGEYQQNELTMFVSRGLGNSVIPIRLFNDPEIACIKLRSK